MIGRMAQTATKVSTIGLVDARRRRDRPKRRQWSEAFKRQKMVAIENRYALLAIN
jgi:hypothetical protein